MTIRAELADGRILEFPEGTSSEVIQATVKKMLSGESQAVNDQQSPSPTLETAKTIGTGILGQISGGLGGIYELIRTGDTEKAADAVRFMQESIQYEPTTQESKDQLQTIGDAARGLETFAAALPYAAINQPELMQESAGAVAEKGLGRALGEGAESLGAPPIVSTLAELSPDLAGTLVGLKSAKSLGGEVERTVENPSTREVSDALSESSPSIDELRSESRGIYKEIDDSGATVNADKFLDLVIDVEKTAKNLGYDADVTPAASGVLKRFNKELDNVQKISDLETLRKVAKNAAKSTDSAAIGSAIIDKIDDFFEKLRPEDLKGEGVKGVGLKLKQARSLWGQARKSEMIQEAFDKARNQQTGFENGLRVQFRQILNNKKKRNFLNKEDIAAMQKVIQGTKSANIAKFLGKFGISENQATSMLGASIGAGGGATIGSALAGTGGAGVGAVAVPLIGQVSKGLAQKLTKNSAKMADAVVRAGKDGRKITEAYLRNTPKSQRSAVELKELLLKKEVLQDELIKMRDSKNEIMAKAATAAIIAQENNQ